MKKWIVLIVITPQIAFMATAQTSLPSALKNGQFTGHLRYFFMSTQNEGPLTDYYASALGGGIRYEIGEFHHLQFTLSEFSIFNVGSSDLTKPDKLTGQPNRYEIGLFDITDPSKKIALTRLEEFYLKYQIKNSYIRLGRQFINSAFINLQDGRMSPTAVEGVWSAINEIKKLQIQLGWLWGVSPRSTTRWYNPGQSLGLYPVGVNADGTKSGYSGNINSKGIAILQVTAEAADSLRLQVLDMVVANVLNTSMAQADYTIALPNSSSLFMGLQSIQQFALANGGNSNPLKTYALKGSRSLTFGAKAGWKTRQWETSFSYNRITSEGRYLAPREWGLDPFFTFLPREKNDGFGNVNAFKVDIGFNQAKARLKISLAAGYYHLPDVKDYALNKYSFPSYTQLNLNIHYSFPGFFRGLETEALIVSKLKNGETFGNDKFIINKVNMVQYNLVFNYFLK
ncbi:MAG TPA: OprD family outer membrane porin [Patescibacteria group bacterium]